MKQNIRIKSIGLKDKLPKGWKYLTSWKCEELLCNNIRIFESLKEYEYYKLINSKEQIRYVWFRGLGGRSELNGDDWDLYNDVRVRGVLVWKAK